MSSNHYLATPTGPVVQMQYAKCRIQDNSAHKLTLLNAYRWEDMQMKRRKEDEFGGGYTILLGRGKQQKID